MSKVVVGIMPTYNLTNEQNDPYADRASFVRMYSNKVKESGGIPIGILDNNLEDYKDICDAYIWPGGSKINKEFVIFLEDAIKNNKPFLGVCLGMQSIVTLFNIKEDMESTSSKDIFEIYNQNKENKPYLKRIDDNLINTHSNKVTKDLESINNAKHKIIIDDNSILKDIYNTNVLDVVSLHKMTVARIPKTLKVVARSEDGIIEAIEHINKDNILGVQFHPEILEDNKIFDWLINKAKQSK